MQTKQEKADELARAYSILEKYRGRKVYAVVNSVSRSGMQRRIEFYCVSPTEPQEINRIGYYIAQAIGYRYNVDKGGMKVNGCGMDMIFHVLSSFNYHMAQHDTGKTLTQLMETKECGERIYDAYFFDADNYGGL